MMNVWTKEDMEAILLQLNKMDVLFSKYDFWISRDGLVLLGSGTSANVYEAVSKGKDKTSVAIKVIGFGNKHVDSSEFRNSVSMQQTLGMADGKYYDNIVRMHEAKELYVWIEGEHDVVKVEEVKNSGQTKPEGNVLHLQFIVMERCFPVFETNRFKHELFPNGLQAGDEGEILKLAYDIGTALDKAHKNKWIHRDVKLENIFYDVKSKHYKLGDFGIARMTNDGLASTAAFTKGYGAPEVVGTLEDKYDYTADIYSFGMMLYVLLNKIRFPGSKSYHPNIYQYVQGYVPPRPINGSDELVEIVLKMIRFNPEERYQSMDEVLNALDTIKYGYRIKYQREHRNTAFALGTAFALIGSVIWKLSFAPNVVFDFTVVSYLFFALCVGKTILHRCQKKTNNLLVVIVLMGYVILASGEFHRLGFLLILFLVLSSNVLMGAIASSAIVISVTSRIMNAYRLQVVDFYEYRWIAMFLLMLSVLFLLLYYFLGIRKEKHTKFYFGKNRFWISSIIIFFDIYAIGHDIMIEALSGVKIPLVQNWYPWILSWNPKMVGGCGILVCIVWMVRERVVAFVEENFIN